MHDRAEVILQLWVILLARIGRRINLLRLAADLQVPPREIKKVNRLFQNPAAHSRDIVTPTIRAEAIGVARQFDQCV